ncbi:cysteine hydrolase family protein [Paenibacillus campi]|uniref:cysteine hydrolase family protein n=1 Tax=Paenibacillus campi TaxID=3106031 RepID=UPI002AFE99EA|nr:cysteine hydrolase family protein [Paenibacillus sp. SGZ-1009]
MIKQALVIIDMQEIFFNSAQNALHARESLIEQVNTIIERARANHIPVVFIQHCDEHAGDELYPNTPDWEICHQLNRLPGDPVFWKTKWDSFYRTGLLDWLRRHGIEQIIFAGAQTEFCLDTTLRNAYSLGYQQNIVVADGHSTLDSDVLSAAQIIRHHEYVWHNRFAKVQPIEQIVLH